MNHPEAVVTSLLHRIKEVTPLVPKGHIIEEDILENATDIEGLKRYAPTSNESCELRFPKLKLVKKNSPF